MNSCSGLGVASLFFLLWTATYVSGGELAFLRQFRSHDALPGDDFGRSVSLHGTFGLVGAPLAGLAFDRMGHYQVVLLVLAVALSIAALLSLMLPRRPAGVSRGASRDG